MELEIGVRITRAVGDLTFASTETDAVFLLLAHLPGFGKDDVEIQINEERTEISISGGGQIESLDEVSIQSLLNVASEAETEGFCQVFPIPVDCVDFQRIDAEFDEEEEMLVVLMPKLPRDEVAPDVTEQIEEESEEVSCDGGKEQIRELEKFEPSDVDREPDQSEMEIYVPEKKEEEAPAPAPEPSATPLESIETVQRDVDLNSVETLDSNEAADQEQESRQEDEEIPNKGIPHQLEAEEEGEEIEEEKIPDVEIPKEEEEEKIEDEEILTAEIPDQLEPEENFDEEEIPTVDPPTSLDPVETMESEPANPSKIAGAHPEEEQGDQSREIETTDTHQEQESTSAEEEEIPPDQAPETETADPHQEQEIPNVEAPDTNAVSPSREQEPAAREQEIPATETADKVPDLETAEQELPAQDQVPETGEPQGREQRQDLKQEDQNAIVKTPVQSSGEDSDKEEEAETTMGERKMMRRGRRRRRRSMPLPPTPTSLVAGSAFIFSLVVLMFHFLKDKRRKPQQ